MSALKYVRDTAIFAPCYVALDWASYIYPLGPFNITPWNPQPALAIAWMLLGGLRYAPAVLAAIVAGDVVLRNAPGGYQITLLTAVTLASGYAAIAWLLRGVLKPSCGLDSTRQLTFFTLIVVGGTAVVGGAFIAVLWPAGFLTGAEVIDSWLRFWVGDAVGVLVTAPLLLAVADAGRRATLLRLALKPEAVLQVAFLAATLWAIFAGLGGDAARHFYLLFLPLIWITARSGLIGAVVASAIVQIGVVIGIHGEIGPSLPVVELQAFVAALTVTTLYLGMMVEERERATDALKLTLRLAAAGEMAGAVAHEVNQPLTALANYGRSAQLLLDRGGAGVEQLSDVIGKMLGEAQRAGEVVRRLRDFFRAGTTRLEPVSIDALLSFSRRVGRQAIGSRDIAIEVEAERGLPDLFVDRLQIELVLRNLVANAVEALGTRTGEPGTKRGLVTVHARRYDASEVLLIVTDNGPGMSAAALERLFEPFSSDKASGMGLGLAISRAIAEAHGGRLEARGSGHGEFHLILPCVHNP